MGKLKMKRKSKIFSGPFCSFWFPVILYRKKRSRNKNKNKPVYISIARVDIDTDQVILAQKLYYY